VAQRFVDQFAPHAQFLPDLTIQLDAGHLLNGTTLTEVAPQTVGPFSTTASVRVDRVVVDRSTGVASIVSGSNGSFTPGAIPGGKLPIARVNLTSTTAEITDDIIVDERALVDLTASANSPIMFRATLGGTNQTSVPSNTYTKVNFNTTDFNVGSAFNTSNARFLPNLSGYYSVTGQIATDSGSPAGLMAVHFIKNGATVFGAAAGTSFPSTVNTGLVNAKPG
jgi:hypothetical protein